MRRLTFEHLESRALPAANPLAGPLASDVPDTANAPPNNFGNTPNEAVVFQQCGDQHHHPQGGPPPESLATPNGHQLEWDDGWWMLDFGHSHQTANNPSQDGALTRPPSSNLLDEWERIWFLDQPAHSPAAATGQPDGSSGQSPQCLAYAEALAELGDQPAANNNGYFYTHAYTMFHSEPAASSTTPECAEPNPAASGGPGTAGNQPNRHVAEVNVPDGGTILLGGIKRPAGTLEELGFQV